MQQGSIIKAERKHGPAVWQFRWSETGSQGQRVGAQLRNIDRTFAD